MFGFIYYGIGAIEYLVGGIKHKIDNDQSFKDTYESKYNTYYDTSGIRRDASTGHPVLFESDYKTKDKYLKDIVTGDRINITEREGVENKFSNNGKTVYKMSNEFVGDKYTTRNDECVGVRYYDKKTNEEYVIRTLVYSSTPCGKNKKLELKSNYYMNTKTGMLIRLSDMEMNMGYSEDVLCSKNEFIKKFNEKQALNEKPKFYNYAWCRYEKE